MIYRFHKDTRASISVEAGLALPFLILLGMGAADYSNMLISHHKMQASLTNAGAYLARAGAAPAFEDRAKNLAVTGALSGGTAKLPGWTKDDITIAYKTTVNTGGQYRGLDVKVVQISTALDYRGFGLVNAIVPGRVTMTDSFEARINGGGTS